MRIDAATGSLLSERTKEKKNAGRTLRAPFYMVCSALFCVISLLGLFLGFFMRGSVGALIAGGEPILHGSFLGVIVEVFRGSIALPKAESAELSSLLPVFLYFMIYVLAAESLLSLVLAVCTFVKGRSARVFCTLNGFLTLFVYGTLCVAAVLLGSIRQEMYSWRQLDLPSLTAALLAFCVFSGMAVAHRGARGMVNVLLLFLGALSVCAFIFPQTPLLSDLNSIATGNIGVGKRLILGFYLIITIANMILSVLRLERPRTQAVDIFRFAVQFAAALGVAAAYLAEGTILDFFMQQPLASLFLLLSPLCAMLVSIFAHTFERKEPLRRDALSEAHASGRMAALTEEPEEVPKVKPDVSPEPEQEALPEVPSVETDGQEPGQEQAEETER